MKQLSIQEMQLVSGGFNCLDGKTFQEAQSKAMGDAIFMTILAEPLLTVGTFAGLSNISALALSTSALVASAAVVGAITAPSIAFYYYYHSNAWAIYKN